MSSDHAQRDDYEVLGVARDADAQLDRETSPACRCPKFKSITSNTIDKGYADKAFQARFHTSNHGGWGHCTGRLAGARKAR